MTKRNITIVGIVLILLIAIGITIVLGGAGTKAGPASVSTLHLRAHVVTSVGVKNLSAKQMSLRLPLLDMSSVDFNKLTTSKLNQLTASKNLRTLQLAPVDRLQKLAAPVVLSDNLNQLHLTV
jgi:hypothetical protein